MEYMGARVVALAGIVGMEAVRKVVYGKAAHMVDVHIVDARMEVVHKVNARMAVAHKAVHSYDAQTGVVHTLVAHEVAAHMEDNLKCQTNFLHTQCVHIQVGHKTECKSLHKDETELCHSWQCFQFLHTGEHL